MALRLVSYLLVTWLVEFAVTWAFLRRNSKPRTTTSLLRDTLLVNALTNPLLNFARLTWGVPIWAGELTVLLVEAPLYGLLFGLTPARALLLSLLANAASLACGPLMEPLFAR